MKHLDTFLTLPVTYCAADEELPSIAIDPGDELVTWQEFHTVRNAILQSLRPFGTVGPMGEASITQDEEGPPETWPVETEGHVAKLCLSIFTYFIKSTEMLYYS